MAATGTIHPRREGLVRYAGQAEQAIRPASYSGAGRAQQRRAYPESMARKGGPEAGFANVGRRGEMPTSTIDPHPAESITRWH